MKKFSDEDLSTIINKIQVLETPKKFRGQCIRSNAIQLLKELKERRESDGKLLDIKGQLRLVRDRCPEVWGVVRSDIADCPEVFQLSGGECLAKNCKECWDKALEGDE